MKKSYLHFFAMVASDKVGNKSPVSNMVQVLVSVSNNAAIPQLKGKIVMSCIVLIQGVFFNWASPEFAKCWPVSN